MKDHELTEALLSQINTGRVADVVLNHMRPVLDQIEAQTISALKTDYRSGKLDLIAANARIATLCMLDQIKSALNVQVQKGHQALEKTTK